MLLLMLAMISQAPPPAVEQYAKADASERFNQKWLASLTSEQRESLTKTPKLATGAAAHTPHAEIERVLTLLPTPRVAFVDFGCGYDARWCVSAAERWKCKVVGVEIDRQRARAARERVRHLGLDHLITIVEGDATKTDIQGDVGVVYLYPEVLEKLRPRLIRLRGFASYMHQVGGVPMTRNGNTWMYVAPAFGQAAQPAMTTPVATWGGMAYTGRVCNSPNCQMCNSIQMQLGR